MNTKETIRILRNISILLEIKGENPFKTKAYSYAADYLEDNSIDVNQIVSDGSIKDIKGFGKALQEKISELVLSDKLNFYENLTQELPESLIEITKISGLGPKKTAILYNQLEIKNIDDLESACIENKLIELKGFGAKTQEMIFNSLSHKKASKNKFLQDRNSVLGSELIEMLNKEISINKAEFTGDLRRFTEVFSEIDIIVESDTNTTNEEIISKIEEIQKSGIKLNIQYVNSEDYIWKLHNSTGNTDYLKAFYTHLNNLGFTYDSNSIYKNNDKINLNSELELYSLLNLQYVPVEIRESALAIEKAKTHSINQLITNNDLKGMLHFHTNWSDGRNSLREMAIQIKELGFEYAAVCDHSAYAAYANGLTIDRVYSQFKEINKLNNESIGITLLKGIESDILPDGSLDYNNELLKQFDIVVASIHSNFRMNKKEMTDRIIKAIKNPYTTVIGHPTGRLLLTRAGYEIDIDDFINACSDYGKVIEINANPYRLDFSWENCVKALDKGVKFAINPDSHKTETLKDVFIGVKSARKAWITKEDVINCLPLNEFVKNYVEM